MEKILPDVTDKVKEFILTHPDVRDDKTRWVEGMGWDQTRWSGGQFPTAVGILWFIFSAMSYACAPCFQEDLASDPLLMDRPISLTRVDGHARWVSPHVLGLIGELPEEVDGGLIVRDQEGRPTGLFPLFALLS